MTLPIAARLIEAIEQEARARQLHALVAVIDVEHAASISLFSRHGYDEHGRLREIGWKFGQRRDEVFLVKLLAPSSGTPPAAG
jgi:phosphinothricin acetyltransferase